MSSNNNKTCTQGRKQAMRGSPYGRAPPTPPPRPKAERIWPTIPTDPAPLPSSLGSERKDLLPLLPLFLGLGGRMSTTASPSPSLSSPPSLLLLVLLQAVRKSAPPAAAGA